ncbi:succinylglutamate desuccinylase/aspartoacylase family protein [Roseivirga sp. BDSF3-8]|uniref:succinylglutamate desuccinylase/aspartoacylase family protein n=1 Tax=Roseivirga sp. BDSF3-8 TaxID=3241598 RepID=UPI003531A26E
MIEVYSPALDRTVQIDRFIGHIQGNGPGPVIVFFAGIHGNEPAGIFALHQVLNELRDNATPLGGTMYALAGNLWALQHGERFHREDLNRIWTRERIAAILDSEWEEYPGEETREQAELLHSIQEIISNEQGPFYFIDLHTTSSRTVPFITVNDSLLNRRFTSQYPLPVILGIEEYLTGPLLSYLNELGYVSFGFEGGSHDDPGAIRLTRAFIYHSMQLAGIIDNTALRDENPPGYQLKKAGGSIAGMYEITHRHVILPGDSFTMHPGFRNFQKVHRGEPLAVYNEAEVAAPAATRLFMPLYQRQGEDGFFLVRHIPAFFLWLSARLRSLRADRLLRVLPGVRSSDDNDGILIVDLNIARFFTKPFLHLLGYRVREHKPTHLIVRNREAASRYREYTGEKWWSDTTS